MNSTHLMNDDVLKLILSYLRLDEKLKLQRVSKQFEYCVNDLLHFQTGLTVGNFLSHCNDKRHSTINGDFSKVLKQQFINIPKNKEKLLPLFSKCPNLKCLELANCKLDEETIQWFKSLFPKLECFRIESTLINMDENSWSRIGKCLSDFLTHLFIYGYYLDENSIILLISYLPKLQELSVKHYKQNFGLLFRNLGPDVRTISLINCNDLSQNDIQFLENKEIQHFSVQNCNNSNEVFNEICHKMVGLKTFSLRFNTLDDSFARLRLLKNLESLSMNFYSETFLNFRLLGSNQLSNLKYLSLVTCCFTPGMLENIDQQLPNLTKLKLMNCSFYCECQNPEQEVEEQVNNLKNDCDECQQKCCYFISKLQNLKTLSLKYSLNLKNHVIYSLKLFNNVNKFEIDLQTYTVKLIDQFIDSVIDLVNRNTTKRIITIKLNEKLFKYIINDKSKIIPQNLRIILLIPKIPKLNF